MNVQWAKSTAGRLLPKVETLRKRQLGARFASGKRSVIVTLWKLYESLLLQYHLLPLESTLSSCTP